MTTQDPRAFHPAEQYPGEALVLLRKVSADLDHLRARLDAFEPILQRYQTGGLLGARRAARAADHPRGRSPNQ